METASMALFITILACHFLFSSPKAAMDLHQHAMGRALTADLLSDKRRGSEAVVAV